MYVLRLRERYSLCRVNSCLRGNDHGIMLLDPCKSGIKPVKQLFTVPVRKAKYSAEACSALDYHLSSIGEIENGNKSHKT